MRAVYRNAFNGGELSQQVSLRADLDIHQRGAAVIENLDVGQAGGLRRRRGFRLFAKAQNAASRLFGYKYTNNNRCLVEVGTQYIRVYATSGELLFEATSYYTAECVRTMRALQMNSVLLLTCSYLPPFELRCDSSGTWAFERFMFKEPPWRYHGLRDYSIVVSARADGETYNVTFDGALDAPERTPSADEAIRASFYTDTAELKISQTNAFNMVTHHIGEGGLSSSTSFSRGATIAVRRTPESCVYSCIKAWSGETNFINGLIDPANYTAYFQVSADSSGASKTVSELTKSQSYAAGDQFAFVQGYWDLFTCVQDFNGSSDYTSQGINPEDYPGHFVRGLFIGSAPCKGRWTLYTTGTWYGSYEVRAGYDGSTQYDDWEYRAECFSRNAGPSNTPVAGDESAEECYISLWMTRVRAYGDAWAKRNFPADNCGNVLTVMSYKHDMVLQYKVFENESYYVSKEPIKVLWYGNVETFDWSWGAFGGKYGFPRLACTFNQRLLFAGTDAQPLSIWGSQVDDIDNFDIIDADNSAFAFTLACPTQDPIRWMHSQNNRIMLGTAEGEYVLQAANGGALTATNINVSNHGFVGAAEVDAVQATDRLVYLERGGGRVMQHGYDYAQDAYISTDQTVFAEHVLQDGGGAKEGCFLRKPDAKAVFVRRDGQLALMTYNSMHQVNAWHRYTTPNGKFLSVAMLPNGDAADSLYAVVARREVVVPEDGLPDPTVMEDVYYIDCCDDSSSYDDHGLNYTSTLLSNILTSTQLGSSKKLSAEVSVYLAEERRAEGVEVTTDGGATWAPPSCAVSSTLGPGWVPLNGFSEPGYDLKVGFRIVSGSGFTVLGMQAAYD